MCRLSRKNRPAERVLQARSPKFRGWQSSKGCHQSVAVPFDESNLGVSCLAESGGVLSNGVQHRLNIRWRAGDHAQDLARRRLLLQRLFEFLEQPNVLNSDDCLIGES